MPKKPIEEFRVKMLRGDTSEPLTRDLKAEERSVHKMHKMPQKSKFKKDNTPNNVFKWFRLREH